MHNLVIDMKTVLKKLISAVYASPDIKERDKIVFDVGGGESVLYYSGSIELDCIQSSSSCYYHFKNGTPINTVKYVNNIVEDTYTNIMTGKLISGDKYRMLIEQDDSLKQVYKTHMEKAVVREPLDINGDDFTHYKINISRLPYVMPDPKKRVDSEYVQFLPSEYVKSKLSDYRNDYAEVRVFPTHSTNLAITSRINDYIDRIDYAIPLSVFNNPSLTLRVLEEEVPILCKKIDEYLLRAVDKVKSVFIGDTTFTFEDIKTFIDDSYLHEDIDKEELLSELILKKVNHLLKSDKPFEVSK